MPPRTNRFQQLIYILKNHLASDATVTESALLIDRATGEEREVDVVIESLLAGHPHTIKIECRDHKRPQSVCWIDEMWGKHRDLPSGVLVLASSSGFTPNARGLAAKRGIELVEVDTSSETAQRIADRAHKLAVRLTSADPQSVVARIESVESGVSEEVNIESSDRLFLEDGRLASTGGGLVQMLVQELLDSNPAGDQPGVAGGGKQTFAIDLDPALFSYGAGEDPVYLYAKKNEDDAEVWKLTAIKITGPLIVEYQEVALSHSRVDKTDVSYGEVQVLNDNLLFVASTDGGVEHLSLRTSAGLVIQIN
jgi:hypothetical protein